MSYDRRRSRPAGAGVRLRTLCALVVLLAAVVFDLQWIWGVLFLFWSAQSLFAGVTFLVEPVYRDENPRLFWAIAMLWFGLSLALIATELVGLGG